MAGSASAAGQQNSLREHRGWQRVDGGGGRRRVRPAAAAHLAPLLVHHGGGALPYQIQHDAVRLRVHTVRISRYGG